MSGFPGMNDWEEYWEANREHIEKMFGPLAERSRKVHQMSNLELSSNLYKMILDGKLDDLLITEAAERLSVAKDLTEAELGRN